ncbi:uncharacterized protein TRIADDRAFT_24368 [Trichoplax adhaerens]|uniref:Ras-related protein Rab-43 n=1 Tax=Trichoplax adhaerens TaxID=10228 RepID=B3RUU3_TRIAD|nr:hypothetical protein TRIADDRAFT_24368 [Trichoplax adhaerens]EDV25381.1 hypothetical protein TRIADDRAFT_24368 [Trichoplax adhaerens]|eukprot:XP_002111414.1 hypothetical protein TRIADDRAFT_24368 [Trichoplax adhaerens]
MIKEGNSGLIDDLGEDYDMLLKVMIVGDAGVGKTALLHRFKSNAYNEKYSSTVGVDFFFKTIHSGGKKIKLQIWDTAGQERFRTITQSYFRSANGIIIAFDITRKESFLNVPLWLEDIKKYAGKNVVLLLVGTKTDLDDLRSVELSDVRAFAAHHNIFDVIETSAKTDCNVEDAFYKMAFELKRIHGDNNPTINRSQSNILLPSEEKSKSSCCGI